MTAAESPLCQCGHPHMSTRSPCDSYHVCGCSWYRPDRDDPAVVARRRSVLVAAVTRRPRKPSGAS